MAAALRLLPRLPRLARVERERKRRERGARRPARGDAPLGATRREGAIAERAGGRAGRAVGLREEPPSWERSGQDVGESPGGR